MPRIGECSHPGCNCPATEGEAYCSTYCHDAGEIPTTPCNCGHPDCSQELASQAS